jgi:hypothetical protein
VCPTAIVGRRRVTAKSLEMNVDGSAGPRQASTSVNSVAARMDRCCEAEGVVAGGQVAFAVAA